jgi:hypothetical protein
MKVYKNTISLDTPTRRSARAPGKAAEVEVHGDAESVRAHTHKHTLSHRRRVAPPPENC